MKDRNPLILLNKYGGEGGIRTLEAFRLTHFPGVLLRPLGHLTYYFAPLKAGCTLHKMRWELNESANLIPISHTYNFIYGFLCVV